MFLVQQPTMQWVDPQKNVPVQRGDMYFGQPNLDPKVVANRITVYYYNELGNIVELPQPVELSDSGVPVYLGKQVDIYVNVNCSIRVDDKNGAEVYYVNEYTGSNEVGALPSLRVDNLKQLATTPAAAGSQVNVTSFYSGWSASNGRPTGGGLFAWSSTIAKSLHNGVTVYAPEALMAWNGTQADIATLLNWTGSGTGAWVRVGSGGDLIIDICMAGAIKSTSASLTRLSIQKAVDAVGAGGGGTLRIPEGVYSIDDTINVTSQSIYIVGESRFASVILQQAANKIIFNLDANFSQIRSLSMLYGTTPQAGATAIQVTKSYVTIDDIAVRSSFIAIRWFGANAVAGKLSNFELLDYESAGLVAESINDLFVSKFIINAGNTTRGALGGIRLLNKVEALIVCDGDILLGQNSMTSDADVFSLGVRPAYNCFDNVFFDSAVNSTIINKMVETDFVDCWFSGGRHGSGSAGCIVQNSRSIRFTNTKFFNCGGAGVIVSSTATDTSFVNCKAESNSVTKGAGISHGIQFENNCTEFKVIGCSASNGLYTGQQGYGIFIGSGCNEYSIIGNNLKGNLTGGMLEGSFSTATVRAVRDNIGFRTFSKGIATINTGATSIVVTHGLSVTPRLSDISLQRTTSNAGTVDLYPSAVTSTTFTIQTLPAPSSAINVGWSVDAQN